MNKLYIGDQEITTGGGSFDPTDINSSISDISTRVSVIETDYLTGDDISTFVTQTAMDASFNCLDTSVKALDASALVFDASIKELASAGGSGGGISETDVPFIRIQNSDGSKWCYVPPTMSTEDRTTVLSKVTTNGAIVKSHSNVSERNYGGIGLGTGNSTKGNNSFATGTSTKADGNNAVAFGSCD